MVVAWALLALAVLLFSVPVYAACGAGAYTRPASQRVEVERAMGVPAPWEGCCSGLYAPDRVVAAQSAHQFRVRPPLAIAESFALYPPLGGIALSSRHMLTRVSSFRRVYALTQRLRL